MGGPNFNATVRGNGNPGVKGTSTGGVGVVGTSSSSSGVHGESTAINKPGVDGSSSNGPGVNGSSSRGPGVQGTSGNGVGVIGLSNIDSSPGVLGESTADFGTGVNGNSASGAGVKGTSASGPGVQGTSDSDSGVAGESSSGSGVFGLSSDGIGVYGRCDSPNFSLNRAGGFFDGGLIVVGGIDVRSDLSFRIDHPLDAPNKYLVHTSVESSERKNVYDGVAWLGKDGAVWVELPEWFEVVNGDFRYQITAIGGSAPNLHVAEEISENRFKIAGGEEGMKVCWQVTGSRKDPWAAANPFEVEQEKPEEVQGPLPKSQSL